jgi:predicted N-acetyltransferase YhbS
MQIRIIAAAETRFIRRDVLKPGLPDSEVHLDGDDQPSAFHLGAFDSERLVGVVTFLPEPCPIAGDERDWRLRGMAVVASVRDRGVGGELLEAGIARVGTSGGRRVWCNGRTRARRFYERHGFQVVGAEFESPKTGPHYLFVRQLEVGHAAP